MTDLTPEDDAKYRAALISIGAMYEDYTGPLLPEWIESAKRIIKEREDRARADRKS